MKKVLLSFLLFSFLTLNHAYASNNIKVYLYDELVDMDNPIIVNGNTLVPLRVLFESLGSTVEWIEKTRSIRANKGDFNINVSIDSTYAIRNGEVVTIEEPPQIINGKTYVPLRFVAESFNQDVRWDSDNNAIHIGKALQAKDISKMASPAVVYIETYDNNKNPLARGSGFIVDKSGVIVTNYHVINDAYSAIIKLTNGSTYAVSAIKNYNVNRDIAILKINSNTPLPTVILGDSSTNSNGDNVFAIGSPKGYENSITDGIISNNSRTIDGFSYIQTSAPISSGNSGGPLINYKGEVIGINTLSRTDGQNLNFSIPINEYKLMSNYDAKLTMEQVYLNEHVIQYTDAHYVGDKKNNQPNGFGIMTFNNGAYYKGNFINGMFEGQGTIKYADGVTYEGEFVQGKRSGLGIQIDTYGHKYTGNWLNDFQEGFGIIKFNDGNELSGYFKFGQPDGTMVFTEFLTGKKNVQQWSNGKLIY